MADSILLLGNPVSRSLSPVMQNAAFAALGIDCRYEVREIDRSRLADTIAELRADERILGANVTIPHKEAVIALLDDLDPQTTRIGAVNTISRHGSRLKGSNTDVVGFQRALTEQFPSPARGGGQGGGYRRVAIIGAGGAARAVAAALQSTAEEVWVIARSLEQARRLCADLGIDRGGPVDMDQMQETVARVDLVVNATPADLPPAGWPRPGQHLFDLRSRRSAEGRTMLLHQGAASFEIWTGRPAPIEVMRAALDHASVPA
ncbi:MAG: shikimate dehydrogenase [Chloroflexota bacterium]|jgi:shikimate dehydrogenase|nr:shikimate dehydrogenase [Chloroflexota bacterium]MEA2668516.1 shikimate dehydrogenase [Chloroflexota bacterium]